jgi:hypothetical protein
MPAGVSAYTALANVTLGSSATSVVFSSINQGFRDLVLVIGNAREAANNGASMQMRFNANSTSIYNEVAMDGNGSSTSSSVNSSQPEFRLMQGQGMSNTDPMSFLVNIMDYATTDKHKTVLCRGDFPAGLTQASAKRFAATTAVSSITLFPFTGSIAANTTFALYGVSA